jgi:hypothetical protein
MPKGVYQRIPNTHPIGESLAETNRLEQLEARIADLERRLELANEKLAKGYVTAI